MQIAEKAGGIVVHELTSMVAVITNEFGMHTLPKGGVRSHEQLEDAARREVYEETGLRNLSLVRKVGVLERPGHLTALSKSPDVIKHIHFYLFTTVENDLKPILNDSLEAQWVEPGQLANVLGWPEEYEFIKTHHIGIQS